MQPVPLFPARIPLLKRLGLQLEKHGLSFGDALNVALFILTLLSLLFAYLGVHLAKVALHEADQQAGEARELAKEASRNQDAQFNQQIAELKSSRNALETARGLLKDQASVLRDLQDISHRELAIQTRAAKQAELRDKARPLPNMRVTCNGFRLIDVSGPSFTNKAKKKNIEIFRRDEGNIECYVFLANDGDAELKKVKLVIDVNCSNDPSEKVFITKSGLPLIPPQGRLVFFTDENIPPNSTSNRLFRERFVFRPSEKCSSFILNSDLESDNSDGFETKSYVKVAK
jgi:hypothetical protein